MARRPVLKTLVAGSSADLITLARLQQFTPRAKLDILEPIVYNSNILDKYAINTPLRVAHFLGQCAVETAYFTTMFERGNSARYKGRGYIQLTGRHNYDYFGKKVGVDLINDPDRAAEPDLAILLACLFWEDSRLNPLADADDAKRISRAINRGDPNSKYPANNEQERIDWTERA
jgi:predicted chitinase